MIHMYTTSHIMKRVGRQELRIDMEDWQGNKTFAVYDRFKLAGSRFGYNLTSVGNYSGTAGIKFIMHLYIKALWGLGHRGAMSKWLRELSPSLHLILPPLCIRLPFPFPCPSFFFHRFS